MQLIKVPAKTGYQWFFEGITLFRQNPLIFLTLFLSYIFIMMVLSIIPFLGAILPLILIPGISVGFLAASKAVIQKKPVNPMILLSGFRQHGNLVTKRLLILGLIYLIGIAIVFASSISADGGIFARAMIEGNKANNAVNPATVSFAFLISMLVYIPVSMLFWFAPVLVAWHHIKPHQALFFSWIACWRNKTALLLYGFLWFAFVICVSFLLAIILSALGKPNLILVIMLPVSALITSIIYCSFYFTYRDCFQNDDDQVVINETNPLLK